MTAGGNVLQRLTFDIGQAEAIDNYNSRAAGAVHLASGFGPSHTYVVHLDSNGEIGEHETGFGQLFIAVEGRGWVSSGSERHDFGPGEAIFIPRGTMHAKGSMEGMTALMVQMYDMIPGE